MIGDRMLAAVNAQINEEMFSSYLYLSMSAWFESVDLPGFASWMRVQAREETGHAMKFLGHLVERGGRVSLEAIAKPAGGWAGPLEAFRAVCEHERHITSRIDGLVDLARECGDHASEVFLAWFVSEQVEEEAHADSVLRRLERAGDAPGALLVLDREMAARS
jgi:ferritin